MCFIFLYNFCSKLYCFNKYSVSYAWNLQRNVCKSSSKVSITAIQFLTKYEMCRQISVNSPKSNFMKISTAVLGFLHADRQTDLEKLMGTSFAISLSTRLKKYDLSWVQMCDPAHETNMRTHKPNSICSLNDKHSLYKWNIRNTRFVG
jgi:hypothetical protein